MGWAKMSRGVLKWFLHTSLGDYQYWKVYSVDLPYPYPELPAGVAIREVSPEDLAALVSDERIYGEDYWGDEALGFGLFVNGELASLQGVWWGERYMRERQGRSWRIPDGAVKTHNLHTISAYRGRGYASLLKRYVLAELGERGFRKVYARIWHSHTNSIRVSRRAGMRLVGAYIEVCPFGKRIELRIPFRLQ
ncbi:GNAT family N-acetyltransferase [Thioalkalivibrio denitrificans]|uniref:GNAT family N-acetyltransferase n=2 Tax=Thioalkalivibrio denitrificans TaxID=108003 RepID=A0A1V3NIL5_9GAMM|nr:GNAT family N-acetyltransferase [Thioalkalivibrio denitrificans]